MDNQNLAFHYVCTWEQAKEIAGRFERYWVEDCGCRVKRENKCARSRIDVCLLFKPDIGGSGGGDRKEISRGELEGILHEAKEKHLVSRPFRNDKDRTKTEGICFCCDDCCGYFLDPAEVCDKGDLIEMTKTDGCTLCGDCADVCYFEARKMSDGELVVDREKRHGCGLCAEVCPTECVEMVRRK
jgi:Pyruvate/2-oxoacid:ferredoxin oxidoreductase delta subunit